MESEPKKLYRSRKQKVVAGVCGGLGEYFEIDPILFRLAFIVLTVIDGVGILAYIVFALVVPKSPVGEEEMRKEHEYHEEFKKKVKEHAESFKEDMKGFAEKVRDGRPPRSRARRSLIGIILILIGLAAWAPTVLPIYWFHWGVLWPFILILIGIFIILRR